MRLFSKLGLLLALLTACGVASSQSFPGKPVRIVLGFSAGGVIDGFARQIAPRLSEALGQPVVVDNRPGANGVVAMDHVAKSAPDGHTIFLGASGNLSLNPLFYATLPYDSERDFAPVTQVTSVSFLLLVNPSLPVKSVSDLVAFTKANAGKVNYASTGNGSTPHLAGELFNSIAGVKATHIPYKGAGQSIVDLIGGQVQFTFDAVAIGMPHVRSGRLRLLATTAPRRLPILPDVPAAAETLPGLEVVNWYGMVVPAGTPREAIARLRGDVLKVVNAPEMRERMAADGMGPVGSTPEEFGAFMKAETVKWGRVVRDAGIRLE